MWAYPGKGELIYPPSRLAKKVLCVEGRRVGQQIGHFHNPRSQQEIAID
jgi:hypothetical protein